MALQWWVFPAFPALLIVGACSGATPSAPATTVVSADLSSATETLGEVNGIAGTFALHFDRASNHAWVTQDQRQAMLDEPNGDLYYLNVNNFFLQRAKPMVQVIGVRQLEGAPNIFEFEYTIAHPYEAPNDWSADATASNRADLGFAGRVVWMAPAPNNRVDDPASPLNAADYVFPITSPPKVANTKLIVNADGYYDPAGTITNFTATLPDMHGANVWPYKLLVDEDLTIDLGGTPTRVDARFVSSTPPTVPHWVQLPAGGAIGNGGVRPGGNYDPVTGGWQGQIGSTLQPGGLCGWTGYGVLHQGQSAVNTLIVDMLSATTLNLNAVIVAKYTDPRCGTTLNAIRDNRMPDFPQSSSSPAKFAYRMPWGALDVERITVPAVTWSRVSKLTANVVDVDYAAPEEATDAEFPAPAGQHLNCIPNGTGGLASSMYVIPELGVLTPTTLGAPISGDGKQDTPVHFQVDLTNPMGVTGGQDHGVWAMVQIVDPEDTLLPLGSDATHNFKVSSLDDPVNPLTTAPRPLPTERRQHPVIYQVAFIDLN